MYKIYKKDTLVFGDLNQENMSKIGYYFSRYFNGIFNGFQSTKNHYKNIFEKMEKAKVKTGNEKIQLKFEESLFNIPITNIELIPYRTKRSPLNSSAILANSKASSVVSANAIIEKIIQDKHTVIILRSYDNGRDDKNKKRNWKTIFEEICLEKDINFKTQIEPSIYLFKSAQNVSISENNIKPANFNNSIKSVEQVVKELKESINLSDFEKELDDIIESKNKS
ncbi:hypothetical protein [Staphylococcus warneri]|uniref:hypothetical protein n=1 Tax=Staphylococcus warneri TaxID=1292 RepID=UPI003F5CEB04